MGDYHVAEVSKGHSSRRKRALPEAGMDSPRRRPERCPTELVWVNGGYQRACSYRHHAAVAEMPVSFCFFKPGREMLFICACLDQPNRRIRDPYVRWCGRGTQQWVSLSRCVELLIYWLNLELAIRLRLTPDSAARTASFRWTSGGTRTINLPL